MNKEYLVIGLYDDDDTRFAEDICCASAAEAEEIMVIDHPGLTVAGVIELKNGKMNVIR